MGLLDKVKKAAADHGDKIDKGIDKAAAMADKRTGGKQTSRVRDVAAKAKNKVDQLADEKRKAPDEPTPPSRTSPTGESPPR